MRILLDTPIFVWWLVNIRKPPKAAPFRPPQRPPHLSVIPLMQEGASPRSTSRCTISAKSAWAPYGHKSGHSTETSAEALAPGIVFPPVTVENSR